MAYPLLSEYVEAIKAAEDNFEQLKHLRPVLDDDDQPVMTSGNFAVVFKMKNEQTGKLHAVKCFLRDQEGRAEAYRMIAEELEYVNSTYLTPIKYLDKELFVDTSQSDESEFPVLLMDWVEGQTLDKYIREHLDDKYELSLLAYQFSRLAMWLMPQPFAHGDLKPDNILVKDDGTLALVDYDGMYVPAMKGQMARELGSPDFRHPGRTEEVFNDHIDDFSLASILLSLKAIALQPTLLEEYGASDRLLFSETDYRNLSESSALGALQPLMQDAELASLYSLYILALSQNNLSQVSFRLFNLSRPDRPQYEEEILSTEVTEDDLENAWTDEYGVKYSQDRKRLLKAPADIVHYTVIAGTKVICDEAFSNILIEFDERSWLKYGGNEKHYYGAVPVSNLESIIIPRGVSIIGSKAFLGCQKLKKIDIKNGIKQIGDMAFCGCRSIKTFDLPYNIEFIGNSSFKDCRCLESIIIPDTVKSIGESAFSRCENLSSIILSENIERIAPSTFRCCKGIKTIKIPDNVKSICGFAFQMCSNLTNIYFPDKLISIEKRAFNLCYNLLSIMIPCQLKEIGEDAFLGCTGLTSITVDERNTYFNSRENCNAIIETQSECLILACKNTIIPNGVSIIGRNAFALIKDINSILLPDTIKEIRFGAFSGCENISSINIPESINYVGNAAFYGCKKLLSAILTNNKVISERLSDICDCLTKVSDEDLANAWTDEYGAKYSLDRKRLLWVPKNLTDYTIRKGTMILCDFSFVGCGELTTVIIPDGVRAIGFCAFKNCKSLSTVSVPNTVIKLGSSSFEGCSRLTRLELPDSIKTIGKYAFRDCISLSSIALPNHIAIIEESTFSGCKELSCIEIPNSVTEIKESAFYGCKKIVSIGIPKNVREIGNCTFAGCEALSVITISKGVTQLGGYLFSGCKSLKSIYIPESVTKFYGHNPDGWSVGTFDKCDSLLSICIPKGTIEKFEKLLPKCKDKLVEEEEGKNLSTIVTDKDLANGWTDEYGVMYSADRKRLLKSQKEIVDYTVKNGTTVICNQAFTEMYRLESAFEKENPNFIGLTTITLPPSIEKVGRFVFGYCINLKSIYIPIGTKQKYIELLPKYRDKLVEQEMGWTVKSTRPFDPEEIAAVKRAEVVASQYGNSVCFFMNSGGQTYIPLSKQSKLAVGDEFDLKTAQLITLCRDGEDDIYRVIE